MSLRDTLRKAAGLLVELPPENSTGGAADAAQADVDAILAQMKPGGHVRIAGEAASAGSPAARTVEQILHDTQGPSLDEIKANTTSAPASLPSAGDVDLAVIYQQAGLPPVAFTAEQMLDMLGSLPPELPLDTRPTRSPAPSSMWLADGRGVSTSMPGRRPSARMPNAF
ncbi:MAG: hypothetical protein M3Y56_04910 [Armatimonadota bacterium]|nr:hypothetical protein [Armatimonadota bacterium]